MALELHSPSLRLRRVTPEDFPRYYELDIDPEVMKFIRGPSADEAAARAKFQRLIDYNQTYPDRGAFIAHTREDQFVGFGFLIHIELKPENLHHEVGYRLARSMWGKGYATEIARSLIEYGFQKLKLEEIFGTTEYQHVVSQKVLMKAGLVPIGEAPYYGGCSIFKALRSTSA